MNTVHATTVARDDAVLKRKVGSSWSAEVLTAKDCPTRRSWSDNATGKDC